MKLKILFIAILYTFISVQLHAGNNYIGNESTVISVTSGYVDNMSETWDITSSALDKPLLINYSIATESNYDFLTIYNVDNNGAIISQILRISGAKNGTISTTTPNGRVKVVFTTDVSVCYSSNPSIYSGISVNFAIGSICLVDKTQQVNGDGYFAGNVGIGTLTPKSLLDITGQNNYKGVGGLAVTAMNLDPYFRDNLNQFKTSRKLILGWNYSGGRGEQSIITNGTASLVGGFSFYNYIDEATTATHLMTIEGNGKIGIGTPTPRNTLEVFGNYTTPKIALRFTGADKSATNYIQSDTDGHYMEYGTFGSTYSGTLFGLPLAGSTAINLFPKTTGYGLLGTCTSAPLVIGTNNLERLRINQDGFVGIGTTKPTDLLSVNGIIRAKEVKIDLCEDLADYVFSPDYTLMPLHKVEAFVRTNKHLPEIPSAAEVKEKGLSMGEMQNKLLQKIEELTLYLIEQQKRIEQLEKSQK